MVQKINIETVRHGVFF